jgi:hypothetical protein
MDDVTLQTLMKMNLEKASLIAISDFEDEELQRIKPSRTVAEYCWTCTPSLPLYVLRKEPALDMITYLDADLFFYSDPSPIYEEMGDHSIFIIEHRFPEHLKHLEANGIYNVQMLAFRNNDHGRECLEWWRERCNEWCFYRLEDGKLGDQKYLDDWPTRFKGVHVLQHEGAGVALWNVMKYRIERQDGRTLVDNVPLIFYHFHQFQILTEGSYDFGDKGIYQLTPENIALIYQPYIQEIERSIAGVRRVDQQFNYGFKPVEEDLACNNRLISLYQKAKRRVIETLKNAF